MAIIKDQPDDYELFPDSSRYPMNDLGELAARLGSPVTFDRRGLVLFSDTFKDGLAHTSGSGVGTGWSVTVDTIGSLFSGYSIKLMAGTDGIKLALLDLFLGPFSNETMGVEWGVSFTGGLDNFQLWIFRGLNGRMYYARFKYVYFPLMVSVIDSVGVWHNLFNPGSIALSGVVPHMIKMVCDFKNGVYRRVLLGDIDSGDLSNISIYNYASTSCYFGAEFRLTGLAAPQSHCYLSHVIITGTEY